MSLEIDEKVVEVVETKGEPDNLIRLSTGVVLRGMAANPITLISVMAHFKRPEPPIYFDKTMGRSMENYADPDYLNRVQAWQTEQGDVVLSALILHGTELHSAPKGFPKPFPKNGEADWIENFELLGLPMKPESQKWRYLYWVKTVACATVDDTKLIQEVVGRLSGVSRADVQAAQDFPGSEKATR